MLNKAFILSLIKIVVCSNFLLINSSLADTQTSSTSSDQPKKTEQNRTTGSGSLGDYTSSDQPKKIEQRRTVGSGSRSGCKSSLAENSISLLVPEAEEVHKTSVSRPSFFLQSNMTLKTPVIFTLINPQVPQPIVENTFLISRPGIIKIELPKSINLKKGEVYLWYVAIPCDNDSGQYQDILSSAVEFVPLSTKVQANLESANTLKETTIVYFENGFWYDAIAYSIESNSNYLQHLLLSINIKN